ncbi:MAG: exodeoxyribonuclease VII large subunit, partial [Anaerolineae bacterium]|nr:exodeoxyribonuclease VII large subunit [Anaerolineae bacterium]
RQELAWARLNLLRHSPRARVDSARQMIDSLEARLEQATRTGLSLRRTRLEGQARALESLSPRATLARGYAIVTDSNGGVLRDVRMVTVGDTIRIQLQQGRLRATVEQAEEPDHE